MEDEDDNPRGRIERLEARMEELAGTIENCRKIMRASQAGLAIAGVLLVATLSGLIGFNPTVLFGSLTALIGGFVLLGSNSSTSEQAAAALLAAENERAALIGRIELRVVGGNDTVH